MIALIAVLRIAANISSLIACSEFSMISSVIGSSLGHGAVHPWSWPANPIRTLRSESIATVLAGSITIVVPPGLDHRGALEAHPGLEQVAVVDVGDVDAARRRSRPRARPCGPRRASAGRGRPRPAELSDHTRRDDMDLDELDRIVQRVRVVRRTAVERTDQPSMVAASIGPAGIGTSSVCSWLA